MCFSVDRGCCDGDGRITVSYDAELCPDHLLPVPLPSCSAADFPQAASPKAAWQTGSQALGTLLSLLFKSRLDLFSKGQQSL